jgi:hypothetical protein
VSLTSAAQWLPDFFKSKGLLGWVVNRNALGKPDFVVHYGGPLVPGKPPRCK